jgi:hypothetical protein
MNVEENEVLQINRLIRTCEIASYSDVSWENKIEYKERVIFPGAIQPGTARPINWRFNDQRTIADPPNRFHVVFQGILSYQVSRRYKHRCILTSDTCKSMEKISLKFLRNWTEFTSLHRICYFCIPVRSVTLPISSYSLLFFERTVSI